MGAPRSVSGEVAIDRASMSQGEDQDEQLAVVDGVDDPVVAHPHAKVSGVARQGFDRCRSGVIAQQR